MHIRAVVEGAIRVVAERKAVVLTVVELEAAVCCGLVLAAVWLVAHLKAATRWARGGKAKVAV